MFDPQNHSEEKFLHDIASPLSTALFILQKLKADLRPHPDPEVAESLLIMDEVLHRMIALLNERRQFVEK